MTLPAELKAKTVELVDNTALDAYIEKHLGREWHLQQNGDFFGNQTLVYFEVYPDPEATATVQAWLDSPVAAFPGRSDQPGHPSWGDYPEDATLGESVDIYTGTILNELCNRGLLPEGDLTVHVWW